MNVAIIAKKTFDITQHPFVILKENCEPIWRRKELP